jgi:hypothetical protein
MIRLVSNVDISALVINMRPSGDLSMPPSGDQCRAARQNDGSQLRRALTQAQNLHMLLCKVNCRNRSYIRFDVEPGQPEGGTQM